MDSSTIICRCEEVSAEEISEVVVRGAQTFDDVKRLTRCGMGVCQAKVCSSLVLNIIQEKTGNELSPQMLPRSRPPLVPVRLGVLAIKDVPDKGVSFMDADSILDEG